MGLEQRAGVTPGQGTSSQELEGSFWKPRLALVGTPASLARLTPLGFRMDACGFAGRVCGGPQLRVPAGMLVIPLQGQGACGLGKEAPSSPSLRKQLHPAPNRFSQHF